MSPEEFRECLEILSWSMEAFAHAVGGDEGLNPRYLSRLYSGRYQVPEPIAEWLRVLAEFHRSHPAPPRPER